MLKPNSSFLISDPRSPACAGASQGDACALGSLSDSVIPDPSFEENTGCPTAPVQLNKANTWVQATSATSDYFINGCVYWWSNGKKCVVCSCEACVECASAVVVLTSLTHNILSLCLVLVLVVFRWLQYSQCQPLWCRYR